MTVDLSALTSSLPALRTDGAESDPGALLERVLSAAADLVAVAGAAMLMPDAERRLRLVGSSDEPSRRLEQAQQRHGVGPGVDAARDGRTVAVPDLSTDERWPPVTAELSDRSIGGVLAVPVTVAGSVVGVLNLYDPGPREWTGHERRAASLYAGMIGLLLQVSATADGTGGARGDRP